MDIKIQRLNLDTSWMLTMNNTRFLIDPWLVGSEVDGFSWFNEQWHIKEPVQPEDLGAYDYVVLSQSYEDHCHLNTLKALDKNTPYISTGKAFSKIQKKLKIQDASELNDYPQDPKSFNGVNIYALHPGRKIDPIYYALVFESGGEAIFYASHGFEIGEDVLNSLKEKMNFKAVITTFTHFKLPGFMGGAVNPGVENAMKIINQLNPEYVFNTHDEKKKGKGLVSKLAKVEYAEFDSLQFPEKSQFIGLEDYNEIALV